MFLFFFLFFIFLKVNNFFIFCSFAIFIIFKRKFKFKFNYCHFHLNLDFFFLKKIEFFRCWFPVLKKNTILNNFFFQNQVFDNKNCFVDNLEKEKKNKYNNC